MNIEEIRYLQPLSKIGNIKKGSVGIFVKLEDGWYCNINIVTPLYLIEHMERESVNYIDYTSPHLIVKEITHENIVEVIKDFAQNDIYMNEEAYWLKVYAKAGTDEIKICENPNR